ncbi:FxLYD domain-containing protein [Haloprofundus salilacus]|uniref:FxLYD domain-containing protein n=1 Tax=Haloprofundus salilacus TaxID=2876190 RepID=UPI001CCB843B|nr:FxLYD domain-containing protein [Haloprofundus salilacus]
MRRRALLSIAGTTVLTATAGCTETFLGGSNPADVGSSTTSNDTATPTSTPAPTFDAGDVSVELTEHDLVRTNEGESDELAAVTGTVTNTGDATLSGLSLRVFFLDDSGETLETATVDVRELAAGRSWTFESTYPETGQSAEAVADYRLVASVDG